MLLTEERAVLVKNVDQRQMVVCTSEGSEGGQ